MMHCTTEGPTVKALLTSQKVFHIRSKAGVFTLRAGASSALGVTSRPFRHHRGVLVLLREAIQAATQSQVSSPASC